LKQRAETVLATEPNRDLRSILRCAGADEQHGAFGADVRLYRGARPCFGSLRKRGQNEQALGRSRGGFSTKIHVKTDFDGLPFAFQLTGGEANDSRNFEMLLDIGPPSPRAPLSPTKAMMPNRTAKLARRCGIRPAIPYRSNVKDKPAFFPKVLYKGRARIAQAVGKLKCFKCIALRCEKTAQNYGSLVALVCAFILIQIRRTRPNSDVAVVDVRTSIYEAS